MYFHESTFRYQRFLTLLRHFSDGTIYFLGYQIQKSLTYYCILFSRKQFKVRGIIYTS